MSTLQNNDLREPKPAERNQPDGDRGWTKGPDANEIYVETMESNPDCYLGSQSLSPFQPLNPNNQTTK